MNQIIFPESPKPENKSLVGRYLKALVNSPGSISGAKAGEYFLIINDNNVYQSIKRINDGSNWASSYPTSSHWELMPEGFSPNNQVEELPEKWGVKVTEENREVLTEWVKKQPNFNKDFLPIKGCVINSYKDNSYQFWGNLLHTEISYETFLKKVLKQGVEPFPLREAYLKDSVKKEDFITKSCSEKPRKLDPVIYDNNKQEEKQEFLNIKLTKTKSYGNY